MWNHSEKACEIVTLIKIRKFLFKQAASVYMLTVFPYLVKNQVNVVLIDLFLKCEHPLCV